MIDFNNLPKVHEPSKIEKDIYEWWETQGYFRPEKQIELGIVDEKGPRFCITLPPPNVTGVLHLGHAIVLTMEDLMTRYERMNQKEALFLPGSDHAGIATQNVVERELAKKNINRKELGRKKFIEEVWKWKEKCHATIMEQSKRMGASCDWTRDRFTLDDDYAHAVKTAFVTLYEKGLIYRGEYMVNWCPGRCESAISDLEAEPKEHEGRLWYIKYPIINDNWKGPSAEWGSGEWAKGATEFIEVATTRPETLLGDSGVATTEDHPIFKKFIGKKAVLPVNARELPIFSDPHVDAEFGTGACGTRRRAGPVPKTQAPDRCLAEEPRRKRGQSRSCDRQTGMYLGGGTGKHLLPRVGMSRPVSQLVQPVVRQEVSESGFSVGTQDDPAIEGSRI